MSIHHEEHVEPGRPSAEAAFFRADRDEAASIRSILERITDAFVAYDREWRFVYMNRRAESYFERRREDLLGKRVWDEFPAAVGGTYYREIHRAAGEQTPREFTLPAVLSDRWYGVHAYPSADGVSVYFRDITEQKRAEDALRAAAIENARLYEQAARAVRARDELLRIVSHDLRNPLNNIGLAAQILLKSAQSPEDKQHLARIRRTVSVANRLIDDLVDVARIDAGELVLTRHGYDAARIVDEAVDLQRPAADEKGVRIVAEVPPGLPKVHADRGRLLQVLGNLIGNAVKYARAGGTVRAAAADGGDLVTFSIEDDGPGIPPESLPHVFDRPWQDKHPRRAGAGLGLVIAKALVEAHGGTIGVESREGRGTTVRFTLPAAR